MISYIFSNFKTDLFQMMCSGNIRIKVIKKWVKMWLHIFKTKMK